MVFGKLVATCRRMTLDTYFKPDTNTNSKCKDLNIRSETVNFLEEYIRGKSSLTMELAMYPSIITLFT